jgi:glycosyltransferase involved in cell wall biosynthesis
MSITDVQFKIGDKTYPKVPIPLISVIMPTFKQSQYLKQSVLSVMAQTYPHVELIIVRVEGDQETRKTLNMLDPNFTFTTVVSPEASVVHQLNLGLKEAKGAYITEAASDDFMLPWKIANEVQVIEKSNALLVYSFFLYGDENLTPTGVTNVPEFSYEELLHRNFISDCCLVKREVYDEFGAFDESLGVLCMFDKWLRLAEKYPDRIVRNPVPTWVYRTHPDQLHSKRLETGNFDVYRKVITDSLKRMGRPVPENMQFKIVQA